MVSQARRTEHYRIHSLLPDMLSEITGPIKACL